jgi:hypothetical protein
MTEQLRRTPLLTSLLAFVLWLCTFALGLECINTLKDIYIYVLVRLGQAAQEAELSAPALVFFVGFAFMVFVIWSTEYHIKRIGQRESWRLFGWTLAVELSIEVLYYLL